MSESGDPKPKPEPGTPLGELGIMARQHVEMAPGVEHHEFYTARGLFSALWYRPEDSQAGGPGAVIMGGGAMGGILGGGGLYHELGKRLAADGIEALSVGWRQPNDLDLCTHDMIAAIQLVAGEGASRFVTVGHSFGGAIAVRAAAALDRSVVPGVVTLATQSGGCEPAESLGDRDLILFHGDADTILPPMCSEMVRMLAGTGELVLLPGEGHLLDGARDAIVERLITWIPKALTAEDDRASGTESS